MALAYTAPTWEDGSGTGISASQLQALCNCIEGLVQGSDKAVTNIAMNASVITLTFADGTQETVTASNIKSITSISKTGTSGLVDTYTITYNDGTTSTFTVTNGSPGQAPVITMTASADATSSQTPTVTVTKSGTDANPNFALAFSGLKGARGDKGDTGEQGDPGQTGPQGPRGNTIIETTCEWAIIVDPVPIGNFVPAYMVTQSVVLQYAINVNVTSVEIGDYIIWMNGTRLSYVGDKGSGADPYIYIDEGITIKGAQGATGATGATGPAGADGADGFSPAVTITPITGGNRVNITDATHPTGQSFDVLNGTGSGDMLSSVYDSTSAVATAGGIVAYINDTITAALTASY